ncbi:hypothetical protein C8J56DRAFT_885291 [Mycena floridula]|nr:hypothetical protein C8J56DRAFT_885291 [Mycena floridula]
MSGMDMTDASPLHPSTSFAPGVGASAQVAAVSNMVKDLQDKVIDLLEKKAVVQSRADDLRYDYSQLKDQHRKCCSKLDQLSLENSELIETNKNLESTVKGLNKEISELNEKINSLTNKLEHRAHSQPDPENEKSILGSRPPLTTAYEVQRELANVTQKSFTGRCANIILSSLRAQADNIHPTMHNEVMKTIIAIDWKEPAGFSSKLKRGKTTKSIAYDKLPITHYQPNAEAAKASYLPLPHDSDSVFGPIVSTRNSTLPKSMTPAEIRIMIDNSPGPKKISTSLNEFEITQFLLYRAGLDRQYLGVNIRINGGEYSIDLRQVRGILTLIHIRPHRTDDNARMRHKLSAEFQQLVAISGKYQELLLEMHLSVPTDSKIRFARFPTPPLQHGKQQPKEESGLVNQVLESDWNDAFNASNTSIVFGLPVGRLGNNILVNVVPCVPLALRPGSHPKEPAPVIHAMTKPSSPQVDSAASQLGIISFLGLPSLVDHPSPASDSTSSDEAEAPNKTVAPATGSDGPIGAIDSEMADINEVLNIEGLCDSENDLEDDFVDAY